MEVLGEDLFVKLQEKMDFIPHTQSYGWLKYTIAKRNKSVIFFSNSIENTLTSFPQLFYPLMTRQFFCDFHEKSEDFCVS